MKVYLAGPMRGYPDLNFAAFDAASSYLRSHGHEVFSPAENDRVKGYVGKPIDDVKRDCIMDDLDYIARVADTVALLPGWEASKGVAVEVALAQFLDLNIWHLSEFDVQTGAARAA